MKKYSVLLWIGVASENGEEIASVLDKVTDTIALIRNVAHVGIIETVEETI